MTDSYDAFIEYYAQPDRSQEAYWRLCFLLTDPGIVATIALRNLLRKLRMSHPPYLATLYRDTPILNGHLGVYVSRRKPDAN